ncbi:unnamed protein product [Rotaria socialis]|uniref:CCR4-NOT transcription complex subunit 11 n=1 Tax=Rotaria socialis TaxID=392032 RepID=A0A821C7P9_9BILA|nr:unnamed protein product [Rotaria socialis]CAF3183051.1 unnamed protein product [Rotaria socialis]CAF3313218.1 unnamed protein product [Rotaria socialis]CAF3322792.1 unnamed protein product [Rotaria socialis]CAF3491090.1 unnamed protein product [Rotaria socialis]
MSLSSKDINLILNFLNEDTCGSSLTFEQISAQFQHNISKSDYLRVGNALVLLLQNRDLIPTPQQRLIILFLFNDMYKSELQSIHMNPFAPVFISILQNNNGENLSTQKHFHWFISPVTQHERWFVKTLINTNNNTKEFLKKTPNQILQTGLPTTKDDSGKDELKEKIQERLQQLPVLVQCHLPAVIDDPEVNYYGFDTLIGGPRHRSNDSRQTIERLLSNNAMEQTIHPEFLRLVPPLHECTIDELVWLSPIDYDPSLFTWDSTLCISNTINYEIRQLMDKAYQGALNLQQQQKLLDELDNDPNVVYHIGLVPSKLPILVENSPLISIQCLLKLIASNQMTEYLSSLLNMNMSLHSMEVVNRLSTSMELPQEFLHLYISTCIKTCEETKDKYLQNRFVRLVSVFIQSLIRNKVIDIRDLFLDIQGFCINFRHIKEAGALFQLVKSYELRNNNDNNNNDTTATTMISTPLTANDE